MGVVDEGDSLELEFGLGTVNKTAKSRKETLSE
jgi:hypothetical protein